MNFHTNKGTGKNKKTKRLLLEIETEFFLYSLDGYKFKNRQKTTERETWSVKRKNTAKIYSWFILVKENWKKAKVKWIEPKHYFIALAPKPLTH